MKRLFSIICITFILINGKEVFAANKEYSIENLEIDATILNNGDVQVNEIIQYNFNGEFNGVFRDLKTKGADDILIKAVEIIDDSGNKLIATEGYNEKNNTYEINKSDQEIQVKLFTKSKNESKKINIEYVIKNAAKKYADNSELYWNFYTVENISKVKEGKLSVKLNGNSFDLEKLYYEVFGDGDIKSNNTEDVITVNFKNLTSLIGIKVDFQKEYLATLNETTVIEGEKESTDSSAGIILVGIGVLGSILGWIVVGIDKSRKKAIKKYRDTYIFDDNPIVVRPPSDLPPALVSILVGNKSVKEELINSTFLYLAKRGYYDVRESKAIITKRRKDIEEKDLIFKRLDKTITNEYSHLNLIVDWFKKYEIDGAFTLQEIKKLMEKEKYAKEFVDKISQWQNAVKKDAIEMGFYIKIKNKEIKENSWYNESIKWNRYKSYLIQSISEDIEEDIDVSECMIYGTSLKICSKELKNIIKLSAKNYNKKENNTDILYRYNSLDFAYYSILFDDINKKANSVVYPNVVNSNKFGGISGGSDFSGGGGGGSGAF